MPIGGTIAGARIGQGDLTVYIPGQEFSCTKGGQLDRCQVTLENQPLEISISYTNADATRNITSCTASYASLTTSCTTHFHDIVVGGWLPLISIQNNLGLSDLQLQQLKRQQLHRRNIVSTLDETELMRLTQGMAIALGFVAAASGWLLLAQTRDWLVKVLISIGSGYGAFILSSFFFFMTLLGFGYVD
jgi:hypothetical protein